MYAIANALKLFSIENAYKITIKPQNMDHNYDLKWQMSNYLLF